MMKSILAVIAISAALIMPANAQMVIDEAIQPEIGCYARSDMVEVIEAGRLQRGTEFRDTADHLAKVMAEKLHSGKCFEITAGRTAYTSPEMQNPRDFMSGLAVFMRVNGRRFFSNVWGWRLVQQ